MAIDGLALAVRNDERIIFHRRGFILGHIKMVSGTKARLLFSFPADVEIDRESLFRKKYPHVTDRLGDIK